MALGEVLVIKNIHREGPGLIKTILDGYKIPIRPYNPHSRSMRFPNPNEYSAVIVLGGPQSANDKEMKNEVEFVEQTLEENVAYLGICLGKQVLVKVAGGLVQKADFKEVGCRDKNGNYFQVEVTEQGINENLLKGVNSPFPIFQLHGETVVLKEGVTLLGKGHGEYQIESQVVKVGQRAYGIQGHLEITSAMLRNWLRSDTMFLGYDKATILQDYQILKPGYQRNGRIIINNFLELAGLIA